MSKIQKAIDALDGCDEYSLRHHMSEVSILIEGYAEAQSELAALREELSETADDLDTAVHHNIDLQFRSAEALKLLHMSKELLSTISLHRTMAPSDWCGSFNHEVTDRLEKLRAFLTKPTESGASE